MIASLFQICTLLAVSYARPLLSPASLVASTQYFRILAHHTDNDAEFEGFYLASYGEFSDGIAYAALSNSDATAVDCYLNGTTSEPSSYETELVSEAGGFTIYPDTSDNTYPILINYSSGSNRFYIGKNVLKVNLKRRLTLVRRGQPPLLPPQRIRCALQLCTNPAANREREIRSEKEYSSGDFEVSSTPVEDDHSVSNPHLEGPGSSTLGYAPTPGGDADPDRLTSGYVPTSGTDTDTDSDRLTSGYVSAPEDDMDPDRLTSGYVPTPGTDTDSDRLTSGYVA
ncbi:hypothetical protein MMC13_006767 [Lambiella insularis]|nr:hypothetical protein [Lambiella insularis]